VPDVIDEPATLSQLQRASEEQPGDHFIRGRLVEALLDAGDISNAVRHFSVLIEVQPDDAWILALGLRVCVESGDRIRATYYRRQLRLVSDITKHESQHALPHPSHPSRDRVPVRAPLRLITGGQASADNELNMADPAD